VIVATASAYGKDLLPRVAAKLDAGVASDISAVNVDGGKLSYTRPMYAGNVKGTVEITSDKQVVTVRQSEFDAAEASGGTSPAEDIAVTNDPVADKVEFVGVEVVKSERPDLSEATSSSSGGRALKSAENFTNVIEPLVDASAPPWARRAPHVTRATSRPSCRSVRPARSSRRSSTSRSASRAPSSTWRA
jgi:electron transfer flavoprotein alpha subunit